MHAKRFLFVGFLMLLLIAPAVMAVRPSQDPPSKVQIGVARSPLTGNVVVSEAASKVTVAQDAYVKALQGVETASPSEKASRTQVVRMEREKLVRALAVRAREVGAHFDTLVVRAQNASARLKARVEALEAQGRDVRRLREALAAYEGGVKQVKADLRATRAGLEGIEPRADFGVRFKASVQRLKRASGKLKGQMAFFRQIFKETLRAERGESVGPIEPVPA
ncbi:MAG: hypothetical protein HY393_04575 [Candidatus Diapherotrites archaeon]|nr:hypothetical protein [Candidatus Diapherotrites archaeon]